ncbi:MAG: hypothetical protein SFW67_06545 [Myxococcaceae bacterium]|nr:hypothetical protein [Myxococcaceae bacterium]
MRSTKRSATVLEHAADIRFRRGAAGRSDAGRFFSGIDVVWLSAHHEAKDAVIVRPTTRTTKAPE